MPNLRDIPTPYVTGNKFHVRVDYRGMRTKIQDLEGMGIYNHGYMAVDDALKIFGRGFTDPFYQYSISFQNANTPTLTQDETEYKGGLDKYAVKAATGNGTLDNLTLSKGKISSDPYMGKWMLRMFGGPMRVDLLVIHFDMNLFKNGLTMENPSEALERYAHIYRYKGCFPTSVKVDGDLDGGGGDISIEELELSVSGLDIFYPRYNPQLQDYETVKLSQDLNMDNDMAQPL